MNIPIYEVRDIDAYRFGQPSAWLLEEPGQLSRTWITPAEYELPDGYLLVLNKNGQVCIWNNSGNYCALIDGTWLDPNGARAPILYDFDLIKAERAIHLEKVRDLNFEEAHELKWEALNASTSLATTLQEETQPFEEEPEL